MESLKVITRKDPFWKALAIECDSALGEYATVTGQTIDQDYETFKKKLTQALTNTPLKTILNAE